jgi:hypothetical protein
MMARGYSLHGIGRLAKRRTVEPQRRIALNA